MKVQDLMLLYEYNYWGNKRILGAAAGVSGEQYSAPTAFGYGSLRGTLFHLFETERFWRILCRDGVFAEELVEGDFPTVADLERAWVEDEAAMREYLGGLTDEELLGVVEYMTDTGVKRVRVRWHCLLHLATHGTQHRSEAAALLTMYGCSPGGMDFTLFLNESLGLDQP